jgi:hypothetical protein
MAIKCLLKVLFVVRFILWGPHTKQKITKRFSVLGLEGTSHVLGGGDWATELFEVCPWVSR